MLIMFRTSLFSDLSNSLDTLVLGHLFQCFDMPDAIGIYQRFNRLYYTKRKRCSDMYLDSGGILIDKDNKNYDRLLIRYVRRYHDVDIS